MEVHSTQKRIVKSNDEEDVMTGWRHVMCWTQRAGAKAGVKRRARRRERHSAKRAVRSELW